MKAVVLKITMDEIIKILSLFKKYKTIECYTDGSALPHKGNLSGAGAVFFGSNKINFGSNFLFGLSLHLGAATSNYAEYVGFILA